MSRLALYLLRSFFRDAVGLFLVMLFLVFITQSLRLFDLVAVKGQSLLTLLGQSALTTPSLAQAVISICMGIGIVRALGAMQSTHELHAIHAGNRVGSLWVATLVFIAGGMALTAFSTHFGEPTAKRTAANWTSEIAADLVGRTLAPHQFSQVAPGLTVVIGGRLPDGTIRDFFADDNRNPDTHKTYLAETAILAADPEGYLLELNNGSLQYAPPGERYSEIAFNRYELSLDRLTAPPGTTASFDQMTTPQILAAEHEDQQAVDNASQAIDKRESEILRVLALGLLALAIAGFPNERRRRNLVPGEAIILISALVDHALSAFASRALPTGENTGPLAILAIAAALLAWRFFGYRFKALRGATA